MGTRGHILKVGRGPFLERGVEGGIRLRAGLIRAELAGCPLQAKARGH